MHLSRISLLAALLAFASPALVIAQPVAPAPAESAEAPAQEPNEFTKLVDSIDWKTSGSAPVGKMATIEVPEGYRYTGGPGTIKLMEMYGNLTSGQELGYISPMDLSWFALFEFADVGYVKDDEKDKLDPDHILEQLRQGQAQANSELSKRGMPTLIINGWKKEPFYNPDTKNLEWAIRLTSSDGGQMVNYKTKILGRRGVMEVVLVCGEDELDAVVPQYQKLLTGFSYKKEDSYASFEKGDKVAEYGLTGLIVGGGLLAAAKSGILSKFWKLIVAGVVGIGALLKRLFTGGGKTQPGI